MSDSPLMRDTAYVINVGVPDPSLADAAAELQALVETDGHKDEKVLQEWLEKHPAFVPGAFGPHGASGWLPWPNAVITQPPLTGLLERRPDFMWLASDSRYLTVVCVEIEIPAKKWFREDNKPHGDWVHARAQLTEWRSWFREPLNTARLLDEYQVPEQMRSLEVRQHYFFVMGRRSEYDGDRRRTRLLAADDRPDETAMSWDRLIESPHPRATTLGCVRLSKHSGQYEDVYRPQTRAPGESDPPEDPNPSRKLRFMPRRPSSGSA
ncbi:Shedu anti-phage system protein SduA domain-containing protein [Streptomyces sp. DG2A-72]|uniref:Shedu anti-phage system protein SduA domain-containing protein n=1 Tax=Streptomyces sp. DG2A-72 TaxID=3051386 RepID=UPI003464AE14